MNVLRILIVVLKFVQTPMAAIPAPVIHALIVWQVMAIHVMVSTIIY